MSCLKSRVIELKDRIVRLFEDYWEFGLFMTKFHLLDHVFDDVENFHSIQLLYLAPFEHFQVGLKRAYFRTSMRRVT